MFKGCLKVHRNQLYSLYLHIYSDGQAIMATSSALGHIALWNLEERCLSSTLRHAHDGSVTAIRFLQSQPLLISTSPDNSLKVSKPLHPWSVHQILDQQRL